jgi:hypothetical protein
MAIYKILISNRQRHTIRGPVTDIDGSISGIIRDSISGEISGTISGWSLVQNHLQTNSGLAPILISGIISGIVTGEISGIISGNLESSNATGFITAVIDQEGLTFLKDTSYPDKDWSTRSIVTLEDKMKELYQFCPMNRFLPVHILDEELSLQFDECRSSREINERPEL